MAGSRSSTAVLARVATLSLLMLSAPATEVPRGAAPSYTVIDLGTFGTVQSAEAFELNDIGQVVGYAAGRAFLWENGAKTDLGTLGGPSATANALNEAGQIVGHSTFATGSPSRAVLWHNGTLTNLTPDLASTESSSATGINESGLIVGNIGPSTFGRDDNALLLVDARGERQLPSGDKLTLARELVREVSKRLQAQT